MATGTSRRGRRPKNVEIYDNSNYNGVMKAIATFGSGLGLPYAPQDWPEPGDIWRWKVGGRVASDGYFIDRYLYIPPRLKSKYKQYYRFASRGAFADFITACFPNHDVEKVLSSFSWRIQAQEEGPQIKKGGGPEFSFESDELQSDSDDAQSGLQPAGRCKAGNKRCSSVLESMSSTAPVTICNLCCKEGSFCRDCCCTICFTSVNTSANGGLDYFRCEAPVGANFVCGHIFHVRCGLHTFMAGTVGGSINLNAECLCRPCNSKTDLIPHVEKVLKACQESSTNSSSKEDVQKWLAMCGHILRGSTRAKAINLMRFVRLTMEKIKKGMSLEDVWKVEEEDENVSPSSINVNAAGPGGNLMMVDIAIDQEISQTNGDKEVVKLRRQYEENENRMGKGISSSGKKRFLIDLNADISSIEAVEGTHDDHHHDVEEDMIQISIKDIIADVRSKKNVKSKAAAGQK